ncbi:MAG: DUF4190 domain-containing protein [Acidimicrobiia bacterium]
MPPCPTCGRELSPRATSCPGCGEPGPGSFSRVGATALATVNKTDGYAIASLVCSVSAFFGTVIFGSILGIIFARMARTRLAANPEVEGEGLARIGTILGWVGVGFFLVFVLAGGMLFGSVARSSGMLHIGF